MRNGNEAFAGDVNHSDLGLLYLFEAAGLEVEDNFFFEEDDVDATNDPSKKIKKLNAFEEKETWSKNGN